jgi:hypothetical protein
LIDMLPNSNPSSKRNLGRRPFRAGTGMFDLLVSFTLLVATLSLVGPFVVRHGQLWKSQRNYRLALDELSNQLDRLSALPRAELSTAVAELAPSPFVRDRLTDARLVGKLARGDEASQISLTIDWIQTSGRSRPVTLSAWVFPDSRAATAPERNQP